MVKTAVCDSVNQADALKVEGNELPLHASMFNIAVQSTKYIFSGQLNTNHQTKCTVRRFIFFVLKNKHYKTNFEKLDENS